MRALTSTGLSPPIIIVPSAPGPLHRRHRLASARAEYNGACGGLLVRDRKNFGRESPDAPVGNHLPVRHRSDATPGPATRADLDTGVRAGGLCAVVASG